MKQNEEEWMEYQKTMESVISMSGLDKNIFYDLRGNHDNFGVPSIGGEFDYFSNYSITGQLGRSQLVNSVTLQVSFSSKLLFCTFFIFLSIFYGVIVCLQPPELFYSKILHHYFIYIEKCWI